MRFHWSDFALWALVWAALVEVAAAFYKSPLATFSLRHRFGATLRMQYHDRRSFSHDSDRATSKRSQLQNQIDLELTELPLHDQIRGQQGMAPNPSNLPTPFATTGDTPSKQIAPAANDAVTEFLSWFGHAFPSTSGMRDVGRRLPQNAHDVELQFVARESLFEDCSKLLDERFKFRMDTNRKMHPIGILGSGFGTGKTRASRELIKLMTDFAHEHDLPWVAPVLITYNDGQSPQTDRKLGRPFLAFALRILYFAFRHDFGQLSFAEWVDRIPHAVKERLTPDQAVDVIQSVMDARSPVRSNADKPGLVYIFVDEADQLLDDQYDDHDRRYRVLLKDTVSALHSTMLEQTNIFVLGFVAGVTVAPLEYAFSESGPPNRFLRLPLLDWHAMTCIMDNLELQDARWKGWRSDMEFMRLLVDYAPIPGVAAELLQECWSQLQLERKWQGLDYEALEKAVRRRVRLPPPELALQLLEDAVLARPIVRDHRVVPGLPWTYQELESAGAIVLSSEQWPIVQLIRPLFQHLLNCAVISNHPGMQVLKQAVQAIPSSSADFTWQAFEKFAALFEAAKEMIWAAREIRSGSSKAEVSVKEFYGSGAIYKSYNTMDLQMTASANVTIHQRKDRFPDTPNVTDPLNSVSLDWTSSATTFVNSDGAPFNTFRTRATKKAHRLLIAGQQKLYLDKTVTLEDVITESSKTQTAVDNICKLLPNDHAEMEHLLVMFATGAAPELLARPRPKAFPDHCLLLTGNALRKYFGMTLCDRAFMALSQVRLNVNAANAHALCTMPRIGEELAQAIIEERGQRPFSSWKDLKDRVAGVHASVEEHLCFDA